MADFTPIGVEAVVQGLNKFTSDIDSMNSSIGSVETTADDVGGSLGKMEGKLGSIGSLASGAVVAGFAAAAAAAAGLAVAIGGIAVAGTGFALEVEEGIASLQARFGLTADEATRLGDVAKEVFKNNFGENIGDATNAVGLIQQQLSDLGDVELQNATENAFRLRDAFGVDLIDSISAVKVLTEEYGLSQQQAFDFLAKGFQDGLNASDDFIDSITEYGPLLGDANATADQFFSLLETGMAVGTNGTDRAADAFKEFQLKFNAAEQGLVEGFEAIGLNYDEMVSQVDSGQITVADAFQMTTDAVNELDLSLTANKNAVQGISTQFEDLGTGAVSGISLATSSLEEMEGATQKIDALYENLPAKFEGFKRSVLVALEPIGVAILDLGEQILPVVEKGMNYLADNVIPKLVSAFTSITAWFSDGGMEIENSRIFDGLKDIMQTISDTVIPKLSEAFNIISKWFEDNEAEIIAISDRIFGAISEAMYFLIETIIPDLIKMFGGIIQFFIDHEDELRTILDAWLALFGGIATVFETVVQAMQVTWNQILKPLFETMGTYFSTWIEIITALWEGDFLGAFNAVKEGLQEIFGTNGTLSTILNGFLNLARTAIIGLLEAIVGLFGQNVQELVDAWAEIWESVKEAGAKVFPAIIETISNLIENMKKTFTEVDWAKVGTGIIDGIVQGLKDAKDKVIDFLLDLAKDAVGSVTDFFGITSPSKLFRDEVGKPIVQGWALGISENAKLVTKSLSGIFDESADLIKKGTEKIQKLYEQPVNGGTIISGFMKQFEDDTTSAFDKIIKVFNKSEQMLKNFGDEATVSPALFQDMQNLMDMIREGGRTVGSFFDIEDIGSVFSGNVEEMSGFLRKSSDILKEMNEDAITALKIQTQNNIRYGDYLFQVDKTLSLTDDLINSMSQYSDEIRATTLDPIINEISELDKAIAESQEQLLKGADPSQAQIQINNALAEREKLLAQLVEQEKLVTEQLAEQQRIAEKEAALKAEQSRLKFLQDQQKLIEDINNQGFDQASILGGFQVGVEADMGEFLMAMTRFTSAMIQQTEQELGIASPSKVFKRIGEQTMAGLTQGIMNMGAMPSEAMTMATGFMTQRASAPNVTTSQNNTFNTTINSQMDAAAFQAMLNRSLSNAIQ